MLQFSEACDVLIMLLLSQIRFITSAAVEDLEYCERESFEAQCIAPDEVIRIRSAVYGRMRLGRCVKSDYGVLGCSADVITQVAAMCSGRYQCKFPITMLHSTRPCPSELIAYLEASYECISVRPCPSEPHCLSATIPVDSPVSSSSSPSSPTSGFLASAVSLSSVCGSSACPWLLQPKPGQRLNLTFHSFNQYDDQQQQQQQKADDVQLNAKYCYRLATVVDKSTMVTKDVTACGQDVKTVNVQTAVSANIEIRIFSGTTNNPNYFLIHYQVVGCADVVAPAGGWVKRNGDTARVGCTNSQRAWHLTCSGTDWIGDIGSCSDSAGELSSDSWNVQTALEKASATTEGILAVIGLGIIIGIVLGCSMLLLVVTVYKRRRRRQELAEEEMLRQREMYYRTDGSGKLLLQQNSTACSNKLNDPTTSLYSTGCTRAPLPPGVDSPCLQGPPGLYGSPVAGQQRQLPGSPLLAGHGNSFHCDHMYESPQFLASLTRT